MQGIMQQISEMIKELPDYQPYMYPEKPPGLQPSTKPRIFPVTKGKYMCKGFQRTGKCDWETRTCKKCRFSHEPQKAMMAQYVQLGGCGCEVTPGDTE